MVKTSFRWHRGIDLISCNTKFYKAWYTLKPHFFTPFLAPQAGNLIGPKPFIFKSRIDTLEKRLQKTACQYLFPFWRSSDLVGQTDRHGYFINIVGLVNITRSLTVQRKNTLFIKIGIFNVFSLEMWRKKARNVFFNSYTYIINTFEHTLHHMQHI